MTMFEKINIYYTNLYEKYNNINSEMIYGLTVYSLIILCTIIKRYKLYNIMFIPSIVLLTLVFGIKNALIALGFLIINLLFIYALKCESRHHISQLASLSSLFCAHFYYKILNLPETVDICSFLMIITIQFYWIGKYIGKYKLLDIINYLLCPASVFAGPPIPLNDFIERLNYLKTETTIKEINMETIKPNIITNTSVSLIESKLEKKAVNKDNHLFSRIYNYIINIEKKINIIHKAIIPLIFSIIYAILHLYLSKNIKYTTESGIIINTFNLILSGFALRCKFYFIWNLSQANFECLGFPDIINIRPMNIEFATNVKDLTASWNIYTNLWLKDSVFEVFKSRSIRIASLLTFFVSSFYHGPNICYSFMFITLSLIVPVIKQNNIFIEKTIKREVIKFINILIFMPLLGYLMAPFKILSIKTTLYVWKGVYFYGHIFLLTCVIIHFSRKTKIRK